MQAEMTNQMARRARARIIGALLSKDLLEAVKNRTVFANILISLAMALFYRYMPLLHAGDPMRLPIYEPGANPVLSVALQESSPAFKVYTLNSVQRLERFLASGESPELGLIVPADFEQTLKSGQTPILSGYVMYWVSAGQAEQLRLQVEEEITAALGRPVQIKLEERTIYPGPESTGPFFSAAMALIFVTVMIGVTSIPHLMIEERQRRTLDALLVSPATIWQIVISKALTGVAYTLGGAVVVLALNYTFIRNWPLAIITAIGAALFCVSCGLLLGSAIKTLPQLVLWSWVFLVPLLLSLFLSIEAGVLVPASWAPFLHWVPTVALGRAFRASCAPSLPPRMYLPDLAVGFGAAAVVLLAVRWIIRRSDR